MLRRKSSISFGKKEGVEKQRRKGRREPSRCSVACTGWSRIGEATATARGILSLKIFLALTLRIHIFLAVAMLYITYTFILFFQRDASTISDDVLWRPVENLGDIEQIFLY